MNIQPCDSATLSQKIWQQRYRQSEAEQSLGDTWWRVARALAAIETHNVEHWVGQFFSVMDTLEFIPAGRIIANAGNPEPTTLLNCFVMGPLPNSPSQLAAALDESIRTLNFGGGIGCDFSTLLPQGERSPINGEPAPGPISVMQQWDSACASLLARGGRRGAMMATLHCNHPDIEAFISAKSGPNQLRHFNCSVLVTDEFIRAVRDNTEWPLVFPPCNNNDTVKFFKTLHARQLWNGLMQATYNYAEPGVLFIDRINRRNNLYYCETLTATNPCGEIPLPPYGACDLGSINLTRFVDRPFTQQASIKVTRIIEVVKIAVRMLDNVIDCSRYPLSIQAHTARQSRRIGLGIMGLGDTLLMLNLHYDSVAARHRAAELMQVIRETAYRYSSEVARERNVFPLFDAQRLLEAENTQNLPADIRTDIARYGLHNSHLTAIAPTGSISLLVGNVSSGVEPIYREQYHRCIYSTEQQHTNLLLQDYACEMWRQHNPDKPLPKSFVTAEQLSPQAHLQMVTALQPFVDSSISKTINVPGNYNFKDFETVYLQAYDKGLKGCTSYRPNQVTGAVLTD